MTTGVILFVWFLRRFKKFDIEYYQFCYLIIFHIFFNIPMKLLTDFSMSYTRRTHYDRFLISDIFFIHIPISDLGGPPPYNNLYLPPYLNAVRIVDRDWLIRQLNDRLFLYSSHYTSQRQRVTYVQLILSLKIKQSWKENQQFWHWNDYVILPRFNFNVIEKDLKGLWNILYV